MYARTCLIKLNKLVYFTKGYYFCELIHDRFQLSTWCYGLNPPSWLFLSTTKIPVPMVKVCFPIANLLPSPLKCVLNLSYYYVVWLENV